MKSHMLLTSAFTLSLGTAVFADAGSTKLAVLNTYADIAHATYADSLFVTSGAGLAFSIQSDHEIKPIQHSVSWDNHLVVV